MGRRQLGETDRCSARVGVDKKNDEHSTTFNVGAKANYAIYEGVNLNASALYGMKKDLQIGGTMDKGHCDRWSRCTGDTEAEDHRRRRVPETRQVLPE